MFDLLTALLNSWSLWNKVAGSEGSGFAWRQRYLQLTYQTGPYRSYEDLIKQARRYRSRRELTRAIRLVARADLELRSSPANKLLVLERLILDLATEPKPTPYEPSHQFAMEL